MLTLNQTVANTVAAIYHYTFELKENGYYIIPMSEGVIIEYYNQRVATFDGVWDYLDNTHKNRLERILSR